LDIPSKVNKPLLYALTLKNSKRGDFAFNTDLFTGEDFSFSAATDLSIKDNRNLENFGLPDSHTSNSKAGVILVSLQHQGQTKVIRLQNKSVEIRPFPTAEQFRGSRRQKKSDACFG
jgi:hypothetical protein